MRSYLHFEKPVAELEAKVAELRALQSSDSAAAIGEDIAIIGGFGRFRGESVCIIGHEKGSSTESRLKHNFGMARPEGYRKAERLMQMADRFGIPVLSLVDTAGAYPGIGAEERGQAEAIARSTDASLEL